jgi:hypothetical protein
MRFGIIGLILFILWVIFARYWFLCCVMGLCDNTTSSSELVAQTTVTNEPPRSKDLELRDGDSTILASFEQFGFPSSLAIPTLTENNLDFLNKVARLLQERKDRNILIIGAYLSSENLKNSYYENIGWARAEAIAELLEKKGIAANRISTTSRVLEEKMRQPILFSLQDTAIQQERMNLNLFSLDEVYLKQGKNRLPTFLSVYMDSLNSKVIRCPTNNIEISIETPEKSHFEAANVLKKLLMEKLSIKNEQIMVNKSEPSLSLRPNKKRLQIIAHSCKD